MRAPKRIATAGPAAWTAIALLCCAPTAAPAARAASGAGEASGAAESDDAPKPGRFDGLKLRSIGPAVGGRVSRVAGVAGDPRVYWAATSQGGVWKSTDGGFHWESVFDDQPVASIGSIAVAPSDPNVVYVGSGEANIRGNVIVGRGIFKSTDAGKSWRHVWKQIGQIGTMAVHPTDPDVAFAAVLGDPFAPNAERGVYRTTDGGATWQRVLHRDADTGASDVAVDPTNPRIVFAGLWQARRRPWELVSGGPGSGLWRSDDGGASWKRLSGKGLPAGHWGKVGVAVAPSDGRRVYALIEAAEGGLFRSDDGGASWERINAHRALRQRAWYYTTITVDPTRPDVVWFPQVPLLRSLDGGRTIHNVDGTHHGDHHDLWIDPRDPRRMIVASDGGVDITLDGGERWHMPPLSIAQFYVVDADRRRPYRVGGTMQDQGTASGPSNSLRSEGILPADWRGAGGGEAGDFAYDPFAPGVTYAGEYGGIVTVHDEATGEERNVSIYPTNPSGHGAADLRVRFQWTAPIAVSPHTPDELYHGANVLFRSRDRGRSWEAVSPDLTRDDESKQQWSGGPITGDNTGVEVYGTIFSLALSPIERGTIWAGTDDGLVHRTRDGGGVWSEVTPDGAPEWGTVEHVEASPHAAGSAWVVFDAHRLGDLRPHLYRTRDGGASWVEVAAGLPRDEPMLVVREDPEVADLLYAGTERGLWISFDGGERWARLEANLPTAKVVDLEIRDGDLVIGTSGRGIWILDDLSPIRQWRDTLGDAALHLFASRPAVAWRRGSSWSEEAAAPNPPRGAVVHYWLRAAIEGEAKLEIRDARGRLVRELTSVAEPAPYPEDDPDEPTEKPEPALATGAGLQRAVWDLRWKGAERFEQAKVDLGDPTSGPLAAPGVYTARLTAGGHEATTTIEVVADPRSKTPQAELEAQVEAALGLRDRIDGVVADVRRVRSLRLQANDLATRLAGDPRAAELVEAAKRLAGACDALEARLHNPRAEVVYDILAQKGGTRLHSNLVFLYDWALLYGDGAPTQGVREVQAELEREIAALDAELAALEAGPLAEVERLARELDLPRLLPAPPPARPAAAAAPGE